VEVDGIRKFNYRGHYDFYEMYSGSGAGGQPKSASSGGKPYMITETGATVHIAVRALNGTWVKADHSTAEARGNRCDNNSNN
jgi:hypothetical protein